MNRVPGQVRMGVGRDHEAAVTQKLTDHGWHVEPFGQGLFTDVIRTAMRHHRPKVMLRWLPDLIATKAGEVVLVEAKSGWSKTDNFSIEIDSVSALLVTEVVWGVPVYIVWSDFTVNRASRLKHVRWEANPDGVQGSGTPYMLVRKCDQRPFELAFGPAVGSAAT